MVCVTLTIIHSPFETHFFHMQNERINDQSFSIDEKKKQGNRLKAATGIVLGRDKDLLNFLLRH